MLRIYFFQPNSQIRVLIWWHFGIFPIIGNLIASVAASSLNCVCIVPSDSGADARASDSLLRYGRCYFGT